MTTAIVDFAALDDLIARADASQARRAAAALRAATAALDLAALELEAYEPVVTIEPETDR